MNRKTSKYGTWKCEPCNIIFRTRAEMFEHSKVCKHREHLKNSNQIVGNFTCEYGKTFIKKYSFTYHQKCCPKSCLYNEEYAKKQHEKKVKAQQKAWSNLELRKKASERSVFNNFWEYRAKNPIIYESPIAGKLKLDSKWEELVAKRLDELQVEWYRPRCRLPYFDLNGAEHSCLPDFYVKTYNCFIEVKSPFIAKWQNSQNKVDYIKEHYKFVKWIETEEDCKTFELKNLYCDFIPNKKEDDISFWLEKLKKNETLPKVDKLEEERQKLLQESNIDFLSFGWVGEVAKLFGGISPSKARKYVEKHFPEIAKNCYKRKSIK